MGPVWGPLPLQAISPSDWPFTDRPIRCESAKPYRLIASVAVVVGGGAGAGTWTLRVARSKPGKPGKKLFQIQKSSTGSGAETPGMAAVSRWRVSVKEAAAGPAPAGAAGAATRCPVA